MWRGYDKVGSQLSSSPTPDYPSLPVRDSSNAHVTRYRRNKRKDAKGVMCTEKSAPNVTTTKLFRLRNQQKANT